MEFLSNFLICFQIRICFPPSKTQQRCNYFYRSKHSKKAHSVVKVLKLLGKIIFDKH